MELFFGTHCVSSEYIVSNTDAQRGCQKTEPEHDENSEIAGLLVLGFRPGPARVPSQAPMSQDRPFRISGARKAIHATARQRARVKQQAQCRGSSKESSDMIHTSNFFRRAGICRTGAFWCTEPFFGKYFQRVCYTRTLLLGMVIETIATCFAAFCRASGVLPDNIHQVHDCFRVKTELPIRILYLLQSFSGWSSMPALYQSSSSQHEPRICAHLSEEQAQIVVGPASACSMQSISKVAMVCVAYMPLMCEQPGDTTQSHFVSVAVY